MNVRKIENKKITQSDVAKEAGVSQSAVSRVIAGEGNSVSQDLRIKIEQAIQKLGYPIKARLLKYARPHVLYIYKPLIRTNTLSEENYQSLSSYFGRLENAFAVQLSKRGYSMTLHPWLEGNDLQQRLEESNAVGVIWRGRSHQMAKWIAERYPTIGVNRLDYYGMDSVVQNQMQANDICCEYLWNMGHRYFYYIPPTPHNDPLWQMYCNAFTQFHRERGNLEWLEEATAFMDWVRNCRVRDDDAFSIFDYWIKHKRKATAFVGNILQVMKIAREAQREGIHIPRDLSLIGHDNLPESLAFNPAITCLDISWENMAEIGSKMLIYRILNPNAPTYTSYVESELMIRKSVAQIQVSTKISGKAVNRTNSA